MDFQLICILIIFLLIFILDKIDNEKFTIKSPLLNSRYDSYKSSINIGNKQKFLLKLDCTPDQLKLEFKLMYFKQN